MATRPSRARRAPRPHHRPPLRVVRGRGRRSLRLALVPAAAVLVLAVFAVAALQAYLAQQGFVAARLERAVKAEEDRFSLLRARVAELESPARLEEAARRQGLTDPADPVFLPAPPEVAAATARGAQERYAAKRLLAEIP